MRPKVIGYSGFQSYGQLAYPSLKPGRFELSPKNIWEQTTREIDRHNFHENFSHFKTVYNTHTTNVQPKDFKNHTHVKLGTEGQMRATSSMAFNKVGCKTLDNFYMTKGTEHWKTNYQSAIHNPYAITKANRPKWTLYKPPHMVECDTPQPEYKYQFGELGQRPIDKINPDGTLKSGKHSDMLKMGTTQSTFHIPGYTGFIPEAKTKGIALIHAIASTKIPGYAGHKPQAPLNLRGQIRQYCFSTDSQINL